MRFDVPTELRLFGESVSTAVRGWEPAPEPHLASWLDDRDDALAARLAQVGWHELWESDDLGPLVAGGLELGRAVTPVCVLDEATLGAPLAIDGRIRHGAESVMCAVPLPGWGIALARPTGERALEQTLDGSGTVIAAIADAAELEPAEAEARWNAWTVATLAYFAGIGSAAFDSAVAHARVREQFGRPLSALPAMQARLADAALVVDGLVLTAWQAAAREDDARAPALLWAGSACRDVTASAHQVHGAAGFALETGLHRYFRRAKAVQVWAAALCRAARS